MMTLARFVVRLLLVTILAAIALPFVIWMIVGAPLMFVCIVVITTLVAIAARIGA
jgi:hypothetical protein